MQGVAHPCAPFFGIAFEVLFAGKGSEEYVAYLLDNMQ